MENLKLFFRTISGFDTQYLILIHSTAAFTFLQVCYTHQHCVVGTAHVVGSVLEDMPPQVDERHDLERKQ